MKDTRNTERRHQPWTALHGLLGGFLLVLGLLIVAPQAWACLCQCYYSVDCGNEGEYCDWGNCTETKSPGGLPWDGLCKKRASVNPTEQSVAAQTLDIWLAAFQTAGASGGGEPDAQTLAQLASISGLSDQQHADLREVAISIVGQTLGYVAYPDIMHSNPGFFSPPLVVSNDLDAPCTTELAYIDNGVVAALDNTLAGVLGIVRDGVAAELLSPGQGLLESTLTRIPEEYPNFVATGNCEYPRVLEERTPYADAFDCLHDELRARVHSVLTDPPSSNGGLHPRHANLIR